MNTFIGYIVLGLSLSAPIGPINTAQLDKGIRGGFWHAWFVGLGAITADILYMLLVYLGVIHLLDTPFVQTLLWLFGFFVLMYTGIESIKDAGKPLSGSMRGSEASLLRSMLYGFVLSLSNPLSILFWLGIYGSVLAQAASTSTMTELLINSGAIVLGILLWDVTMAAAASFFRRVMTPGVLKGISVVSGLSLIGFSLYFGWEAFKLLAQRF